MKVKTSKALAQRDKFLNNSHTLGFRLYSIIGTCSLHIPHTDKCRSTYPKEDNPQSKFDHVLIILSWQYKDDLLMKQK